MAEAEADTAAEACVDASEEKGYGLRVGALDSSSGAPSDWNDTSAAAEALLFLGRDDCRGYDDLCACADVDDED